MIIEKWKPPFNVDQKYLQQARAAYFNPTNPQTTLESFYKTLLSLAETDEQLISSINPKIIESMNFVFEHLQQARKFDERYLGHMLTEASIPALYAYMLALRVGSNTVAEEVSRQETKLEPEAIEWMIKLIGYNPENASGTFTSGGSLANTTALWVAREIAAERTAIVNESREFVVLANPFVHYSIEKSIRILGGPHQMIKLIKVPSRNLALDPVALESEVLKAKKRKREIMAIVAIAGETETGVTDDLNRIADIAKKYNIFFHVDAAYGLPYLMSSKSKLFSGIERSDSVTFDPHKALNTPYSAGAVLFRSSEDHSKVHFKSEDAAYVFKEGKASLGQKRIEGSMGAGAILSTLAAIKALSPKQWGALLDHTLNNIESLYNRLSRSSILIPLHIPDLNVLCFSLRPDFCLSHGINTNDALKQLIDSTAQTLWDESGYFFSTTNLPIDSSIDALEKGTDHQYVFRAVLMHPRTEITHINEAVQALERTIEQYLSH